MARAKAHTGRIQGKRGLSIVKSPAFTLAEVMVAVAILGFIALLTYGAFGNSLNARERSLKVAERYHEIRQGESRMAHELSMAFLSAHRDCDDPRTKTIFKKDSTGGGDSITFTSFSHIKMKKDANESDQNVLSYYIESDKDTPNTKSLMRREKNRIDDEPEKGGTEQALITDVTGLGFEFYNEKKDEWDDDWDTENSDYKNRLPLFVKITLKAKGPAGNEETFITKTELFMHLTGAYSDDILINGSGFVRCAE